MLLSVIKANQPPTWILAFFDLLRAVMVEQSSKILPAPPCLILWFFFLKETGVSKSDKTDQFRGCNSDPIQVASVSTKPPKFRNVVFSFGDCITVNRRSRSLLSRRGFFTSCHYNTSIKLSERLPVVMGYKSHSITNRSNFILANVW